MDLDIERLRHIASLAELSLTTEEEPRLVGEIGRILAYVAELTTVDTTGVHPENVLPMCTIEAWREDHPTPGLSHEDALAGSAHATNDGFAVPGFVE